MSNTKRVYTFGNGKAEGKADMKSSAWLPLDFQHVGSRKRGNVIGRID